MSNGRNPNDPRPPSLTGGAPPLPVDTEVERLRGLVAEADGLIAATEELSRDVERRAERFSGYSSEILVGIVGGIVGGVGGISIGTTAIVGSTMVVAGPAGFVLGVALAILAYRGPGQWRVERLRRRFLRSLDIIKDELAWVQQQEGAPAESQERLWQQYNHLLEQYHRLAVDSLRHGTSRDRSSDA